MPPIELGMVLVGSEDLRAEIRRLGEAQSEPQKEAQGLRQEKPMTPIDLTRLEELERLAKGATPGPWDILYFETSYVIRSSVERNISSATGQRKTVCSVAKRSQKAGDAQYITALSPEVVLALIAEIRRLREFEWKV